MHVSNIYGFANTQYLFIHIFGYSDDSPGIPHPIIVCLVIAPMVSHGNCSLVIAQTISSMKPSLTPVFNNLFYI